LNAGPSRSPDGSDHPWQAAEDQETGSLQGEAAGSILTKSQLDRKMYKTKKPADRAGSLFDM
jgi:hypothetical protein